MDALDSAIETIKDQELEIKLLKIRINNVIEMLYDDCKLLNDKEHIAYSCLVDCLRNLSNKTDLTREPLLNLKLDDLVEKID